MATGSIHHPYQSPITCDICEGTEDLDSYCLMCKGPMCGTCAVTHTITPMFRKHEIVPLVDGLKQQKAEEECHEHPSYNCSMHCNVCHKIICIKCISSGMHNDHDMCEIQTALQRIEQEIKEYHNILKNRYLSKWRAEAEHITEEKAECRKMAVSLKSDISNKRTEWITEIHKVCDDMISKVDDEEKQQSLRADKSLLKVQESIEEIEQLMTLSKQALTKVTSELIKFNQGKPNLSHLDVQESPKIHLSTFVPGIINREKLGEQIGKLVSPNQPQIDTSIIHTAQLDKAVYSINVVDGNQAWISASGEELRLVDTDGKVVKRINTKFDMNYFAVTTSGDIIVTDFDGTCIRKMTQTGQVTQTINTNPSKPTGICLGNNNQEIVVCVNTHNETSSELAVYSRDGKEICTLTYTDKPVGRYTSERVTQNNRGDYCVAHCDHNKVYVVDTNGGLRWTYDGSGAGELEENFLPQDICSDTYDNLIISDYNNHKIHMLDGEGKFLRFILTEQDGITNPIGLCIDKEGRLWVGQDNGDLCVVNYLK